MASVPTKPGWYWARWMAYADPSTPEETSPYCEWEVVHVVENCADPTDDEHLLAYVPGHVSGVMLDEFCWGEFVSEDRLA